MMVHIDLMANEERNRRQSQGDGASVTAVREQMRTLIRRLAAMLGLFLLVVAAIVGILTPLLPVGLPIGIAGVILLGRNSVWGRKWMERMLVRFPRIERAAPNWVMKLVFGREKQDHPPVDKG